MSQPHFTPQLLVPRPVRHIALHDSNNAQNFQVIDYHNPDLEVDLGVGLWAWPLPMDYDQDGDYDLVVACPDKPYNGIYFFENTEGDVEMPVFRAGKKIDQAARNLQVSFVNQEAMIIGPGIRYTNFRKKVLQQPEEIPLNFDFKQHHEKIRANQWKYVDFDGDGDLDLSIGIGDWTDYGWDNAYNSQGIWTNGPLHGYIYISINSGTDKSPKYETPQKLRAEEEFIDVYGMPSPSFGDFDRDGDLDLICGEFLDGFTYFQNKGTRIQPKYVKGKRLRHQMGPLRMDLQMITPTSIDWNKDGFTDLICGDEDGRVAYIKHSGTFQQGVPVFFPPQYFQQEAENVKFGALVTPVSYDWDGDGDEDLICGNTAGYIGFVENLDGGSPPKWAAPKYLQADGQDIRIMAGPNGSIQGPCEAKWGYTTLSVADWNYDGLADLVVNSIWGKVIWFQNVGSSHYPLLTSARPVEVEGEAPCPKPAWNWWEPQGRELVTQWRTTPSVIDWNQDGLNDLVMLDQEGYLVFFERIKVEGQLKLKPPARIFFEKIDGEIKPLRLNEREGGKSGRRKFCFMDWDQDGHIDLMVNSKNIDFFRQVEAKEEGKYIFQNMGLVDERLLAGHTTSPTAVDWDKDQVPDLLVGAEDGRLYLLENPNIIGKENKKD